MKKILAIEILVLTILVLMTMFVNAAENYSLTVTDKVSVFVNGEEITEDTSVKEGDKVKFVPDDESVVAIKISDSYYPVGKYFVIPGNLDLTEAELLLLGLNMVDGAQVRVGNVSLEEGRITAVADSGLRFLAKCDYNDTVIADENVEFGIKITAEGSDEAVYIAAEKFQADDRSVFTAAITNLNENNYNRKYTACAYAKVVMFDASEVEFTTDNGITRSIYQVSVGILKQSVAEYEDNLPYTIDDAVKEVLSAYVNQTGIRLSYATDGTMSARVSGKGAYTGDLYFNVTSSLNENGSTAVTVTPLGETDGFFNPIEIPDWWQDYIRINNNNSVATKYISDAKLENGVLSFTFTLPGTAEYTFNQEDNVTIVSEKGAGYIKGFKAGEEVTYNLAETVTVMGLAETMEDVVPGSVIMVGYNKEDKVAAVELVASLGLPIDPDGFEEDFGVHDASDGSTKYKNVVTEMFSKSGSKLTCQNLPDTTKTVYKFESSSAMCYRVGIAMSGDTPVITATGNKISTYPSIFESTAEYHNYLYLRYNSETEKVKECVFYCVPKDLDFTGGGEYSDIFSLDDYIVIIE